MKRAVKNLNLNIKSSKGFTLVEVMITVLLLAFALIGTVAVFTNSSVYMAEIRQQSIATQALKEEIEEIRDMPFDTVTSLSSTFTSSGFSGLVNPVGTRTIDDPYSDNDIRRVTVSLAWESPQGRGMSSSMGTLVTREGINKQ